MNCEEMARLCSIYACDRALKEQTIELPHPGTPECDPIFLATWDAFRYVTTELGRLKLQELGIRQSTLNPLEAFVYGREVPAHIRWAEAEAMILAGEWGESSESADADEC